MKNILVVFDSANKDSKECLSKLKGNFLQLLTKNDAYFEKFENKISTSFFTYHFFDIKTRNLDKFLEKIQSMHLIYYISSDANMDVLNKLNSLKTPDVPTLFKVGLQTTGYDLFKLIDDRRCKVKYYRILDSIRNYTQVTLWNYQQNTKNDFNTEQEAVNEIVKRTNERIKKYQDQIKEEQEFLINFKKGE